MDQFVLFGDSITQGSYAQERGFAFGAELTNQYVRRLDVINRGFSGYNTAQALKACIERQAQWPFHVYYEDLYLSWNSILPHVLPAPTKHKVRFFAIFFGANDARLPNTPGPSQAVDLEAYRVNLLAILSHPAVKAHEELRIILITPPPIDERLQEAQDREKYPDFQGLRRTAKTTAAYAQVVREVGADSNVAVLDLWGSMMKKAGWEEGQGALAGSKELPQNQVLVDLLVDGLHFKPTGYKVLYEEMMVLIAKTWPDQLPENLPMVLPAWDDLQAWK